MTKLIDFNAVRSFITEACGQYEKSAPALADWLDELYMALDKAPATVSALELFQLGQLKGEDGWEHPNYAQNRWYHVRSQVGKDCGVLSF